MSWQWFLHKSIKDPGPTFDTRPCFVIMQTLGCHIGSDHINISCHPFEPLSRTSIPPPPRTPFRRLSPPRFLPLLSGVIWDRREQDFHIR